MQEMLQSLNSGSSSDPSVLERQKAHLQWQESLQSMEESLNFSFDSFLSLPDSVQTLQSDQYSLHDFSNGLPNFSGPGCSVLPEHALSVTSLKNKKEASTKKRKTEKHPMVASNVAEKVKRIKGSTGGDERATTEVTEEAKPLTAKAKALPDISMENGVPLPPPKQDFIHVRARRGQATDSHSLAERVRREKISERMKYLQGLVPGCNRITGKAGMLDEIINYVQSLQRQVEFLSMKLATVNPWVDFNIESFSPNEVDMTCKSSNILTLDVSHHMVEPSFVQMNPMHQVSACCGLSMDMNASELTLERTLSAPVILPGAFLDTSFDVLNSSRDTSSQSISAGEFHQTGKGSMLPLQSLQGNLLPNNLKMEM